MKFLKKLAPLLIAAVAVALTPSLGLAQITGSKHDLSSGNTAGGTGPQGVSTTTSQICVFCHTPHGSNTGVEAPLWNKTVPATAYQRYSDLASSTLDGEELAVGSVSLACLSCHDGSQAMDVVLNAPGSGGYVALGQEIDLGAVNAMTGTPIPQLGGASNDDLRDDHPVSIAFAGGACIATTADCDPAGAASGDPDFHIAQYDLINGNNAWWVDTEATPNNTRNKTDMILYTRTFTGGSGPSVECGSCHDPHEGGATPVSFMRIANSNSAVCLSCHIK